MTGDISNYILVYNMNIFKLMFARLGLITLVDVAAEKTQIVWLFFGQIIYIKCIYIKPLERYN